LEVSPTELEIMTWYANEVLMSASARAIGRISQDSLLQRFAYVIKNLDDYSWYIPEHKHDLPPDGLLVVRPVRSLSSEMDWYDEPILDWASLPEMSQTAANLDEKVEVRLREYVGDENIPPRPFRMFLSSLATEIGSPVLYYACFMWGGDIESEYCLLYAPNEILMMTQIESKNVDCVTENALKDGLVAIGIHLKSWFFAPHTRSFPWETKRI
jgi:hypothetical protein